ncbi:hypothetical protein P3319_07100 [Lactobacillus kefiranofaciens]|uniref:hypothetical protein n=1 Tax=Lactobacillus kefiranofaciens TaxID=267818 RepID=UPI001664E822|nr:hypothetical protein [Lactobacillus kefiranofaciens]MDF4142767.1 hypothetical protein [Lactobacillus kefiranofaciens]QNT44207.1 hypothetical protein ICI50_00065 [Lactobacillus kefiranofaciens]
MLKIKQSTLLILLVVFATIAIVATVVLKENVINPDHWLLGVPIRWTIPYLTWS